MLHYKNDKLKSVSDLHTQLTNTIQDLVDSIDEVGDQTYSSSLSPSWWFINVIQYYDESEANTWIECYTDPKKAEQRFYELMEYLFPDELKDLKWIDWNNTREYHWDDFVFSKDDYSRYYDDRLRKWEYGDDYRYPRYTWRAWSPSYYSELFLKKIPVNNPFILNPNVKPEWAEKN